MCFIRVWGAQKDEAFSAVFWLISLFSSWWFLAQHFWLFWCYSLCQWWFHQKGPESWALSTALGCCWSSDLASSKQVLSKHVFPVCFFYFFFLISIPFIGPSVSDARTRVFLFLGGRNFWNSLCSILLLLLQQLLWWSILYGWSNRDIFPDSIKCTRTQREWE